MQPASLRKDFAKVSENNRADKGRGRVCAFTRHPTALATAQAYLLTLKLRGLERLLVELLVTRADRQGLYWGQITGELLALMKPGVHLAGKRLEAFRKRVSVTARSLQAMGLITWKRVPPFSRYPRRVSYHKPAEWARGEYTISGGRVWIVCWEKFGVAFACPLLARNKQRGIPEDPTRWIPEDPTSDPLGSPLENLTGDPALAGEAPAAAPAAPAPMTEIGPPLRSALDPDESAAPLAPKVASETPLAPVASEALPHDPTIKREPESAKGVRAPRSRPPVPLPDFLAELERRFGDTSLLTTASELQNRPKRE